MRLAITKPEQLRLKMVWVLSQILVVSGVEISRADEMVPYQRLLYNNAFDNYATILRNVTLNAAMGEYFDNVNNGKGDPARGSVPNESFAREAMQLFTIGVHRLQINGAPVMNSSGMPDPTYNQDIVIALSRALTGWTFTDGRAGAPVEWQPENYSGPMEPVERYHDTGEKILMDGFRIPLGQTATQHLNMALDHLFRHPNVGPFIGRLLMQHFVTSNPSGAYIQRVAEAFNNSGGVRGDMRAVLRQVLTDPEATGTPSVDFGRMREPFALMAAQIRPLRPVVSDYPFTTDLSADIGQRIFYSPSVFNYCSPNYRPAGVPLYGPEFQLFNTATALQRINFVGDLTMGGFSGSAQLDYGPFVDAAADPALLTELADRAFFGNTASQNVKTAITDAIRQIA
ncbi:MAG: DUF1800 domain-containing protein [Acidobacteria bacterium]|nr:DUF1800 domain-containing protein [Acidobacteriota bacterium]